VKKLYALIEIDSKDPNQELILCTSLNGATIKSEFEQRIMMYQGFGYLLECPEKIKETITLLIHVEYANGLMKHMDQMRLYRA